MEDGAVGGGRGREITVPCCSCECRKEKVQRNILISKHFLFGRRVGVN